MAYKEMGINDIAIIEKLLAEKKTLAYISSQLNISIHNIFKVKSNYKKYDRGNVIRIDHVNESVFQSLKIIAENTDTEIQLIVKRQLRSFVENTPNHLKIKKIK